MTTMTEEWAMLWYQCLSENYDYSMYSKAHERGDLAKCQEYESKFERLAEIYADFGKLTSLDERNVESYPWKEWFEFHKHLFVADVQALKPQQVVNDPTRILLSVSMQGRLDDTIAEASRLITRAFANAPRTQEHVPKYQLRTIGGKPAVKLDMVRSAVITSVGKWAYSPDEETPIKVNEALMHFLQHHISEMGWKLGDKEMHSLRSRGYLQENLLESFRIRVNRSRKLFRALSRNTIRASFPDKRPFKSLVWDRFQMEQTDK